MDEREACAAISKSKLLLDILSAIFNLPPIAARSREIISSPLSNPVNASAIPSSNNSSPAEELLSRISSSCIVCAILLFCGASSEKSNESPGLALASNFIP